MTARSGILGRPIEFRPPTGWVYTDTGAKPESSPEVEIKCARCGKPNVMMPVPIPSDLSCDGIERWKVKHIDACIAPIVKALNDAGILTRSSCCGHGADGSIELWDGRTLIVKRKEEDTMNTRPSLTGHKVWLWLGEKEGTRYAGVIVGLRAADGTVNVYVVELDQVLPVPPTARMESREPGKEAKEECARDAEELIQGAKHLCDTIGTGLISLPVEFDNPLYPLLVALRERLVEGSVPGINFVGYEFEADRDLAGKDQFAITLVLKPRVGKSPSSTGEEETNG